MKRKDGFILQQIGGEAYAVAVTPESARLGSMIRLNATGALLFSLLEKETTAAELTSALAARFDIDEATAARDVERFLASLCDADLLA